MVNDIANAIRFIIIFAFSVWFWFWFLVRAVSALLTLQILLLKILFTNKREESWGEQKDNKSITRFKEIMRQELVKNRKRHRISCRKTTEITLLHVYMHYMHVWHQMACQSMAKRHAAAMYEKVFPLKSKRSNETRVKASQTHTQKKQNKSKWNNGIQFKHTAIAWLVQWLRLVQECLATRRYVCVCVVRWVPSVDFLVTY